MKLRKKLFIFLAIASLLAAAFPALAQNNLMQDVDANLQGLGAGAGYSAAAQQTPLPVLIGRIINILLSVLGVIFVVLVIYGGTLWMTSFGNEQKVTRGKELIIDATIGLVITLLAYAIANFVVGELLHATLT